MTIIQGSTTRRAAAGPAATSERDRPTGRAVGDPDVRGTQRPSSQPSGSRGHLRSVDVVRVITVAGVISVHAVSSTTSVNSQLAGALTSLLHVNREIFLLLSAFVLTYAYGRRPTWKVGPFWKRRYLLVVTPYVCWSAIYVGLDGWQFSSVGQGLSRFGYDLATGTASFQLYFLLLTMQLYLIFPLLLKALKATQRHHLALLVVSFAFQVAFTSAFYYWPTSGGVLGYWANHSTTNLLSYEFFVIAGGVAAMHLDQLASWVAGHRRLVIGSAGVTVALGLANYYAGLSFLHMSVARASQVFQPVIALEALVLALGLFCLGQWVDERNSRRFLRAASVGSDASFGIYLAHPIILTTLLIPLLRWANILSAVRGAGVGVTLAFDLVVIVPLVYATCALGVVLARRRWFSLALTGRPSLGASKALGGRAGEIRTKCLGNPVVSWILSGGATPSPVGNRITP